MKCSVCRQDAGLRDICYKCLRKEYRDACRCIHEATQRAEKAESGLAAANAEIARLTAENDEMRTAFGDWRCVECDEWQGSEVDYPEDGLCEICRDGRKDTK